MKYKIKPCDEVDEELIGEKLTVIDHSIVPPDENTGEACFPVRSLPEAKEEVAVWFHER